MGGRLLNEARVMIRDKTLDRALDRLRKPEPRLVPTYTFDYRTRRRGDYLLVLQRPPLRAKATWRDHSIPSRWAEKVDRRNPPTRKTGWFDHAVDRRRHRAG